MTVGIVTISFNQGRFLEEAIGSVNLAGDHKLEYVVVDPGSTDGSREIIAKYRDKFSATILEPDRGPADGLNKGFSALVEADVCGYLNADDRLSSGALDYIAEYFLKNKSVDLLLGSIQIIDERGRRSVRGRHVDRVSLQRYADRTCCVWQQATFFRASAFRKTAGFNLENRISWDSELVVDMLLAGAHVGYTNRALGEFRIYSESITGSIRRQKDLARVLEQKRQQRRVAEKIYAAGYAKRTALVSKALEAAYRFNPYRHLSNVRVALSEGGS